MLSKQLCADGIALFVWFWLNVPNKKTFQKSNNQTLFLRTLKFFAILHGSFSIYFYFFTHFFFSGFRAIVLLSIRIVIFLYYLNELFVLLDNEFKVYQVMNISLYVIIPVAYQVIDDMLIIITLKNLVLSKGLIKVELPP